MPTCTKVRFVNVRMPLERGRERVVPNQLLNFAEGKNALVRMRNGTGKSTLISFIGQVFSPRYSSQGRRLSDYFRGRDDTTYVLVEIEKDGDTPERWRYATLGVAIRGPHTDAQRERGECQRFWFILENGDSRFGDNIATLPLAQEKDGQFSAERFDRARQMLKEKGCEVFSGTAEFKDGYAERLREMGIGQDEWAQMDELNVNESGLANYFARMKTDRKLFEDGVLRLVEEGIWKDSEDSRDSLAKHVVACAKEREATEQTRGYVANMDRLAELMDGLREPLGQELLARERLTLTWVGIQQLGEVAEQRIVESQRRDGELEGQLDDLREQEAHIEWQQASIYYHQATELLEVRQDAEQVAHDAFDEAKRALDENRRSVAVQRTAQRWRDYVTAESRVRQTKADIAAREQSSDEAQEVRRLKYSARLAAERELESTEQALVAARALHDEAQQEASETKRRHTLAEDDLRAAREAEAAAEATFTVLKSQLSREQLERQGLNDLVYLLSIEGNLGTEQLDELVAACKQERQATLDERTDALTQVQASRQELDRMRSEKQEQELSLQATKSEAHDLEGKLAEYERRYQEFSRALSFDEDIATNWKRRPPVPAIAERIREHRAHEVELAAALDIAQDELRAAREGLLHVERDVRDWLAEHHIEYQTLDQLELPAARRAELLAAKPHAAYALIMNSKNYERLQHTRASGSAPKRFASVVPIVLSRDFHAFTQSDAASELRLLSWYDDEYLSDPASFEHRLGSRVAELESGVAHESELVALYEGARDKALAFLATCGGDPLWEERTRDELQAVYRRREELKGLVAQIEADMAKLGERIDALRRRADELQVRASDLKRRLDKLEGIRQINKQLLGAIEKRDKALIWVARAEEEKRAAGRRLQEAQAAEAHARAELEQALSRKTALEELLSQVSDAQVQDNVEPGGARELVERYLAASDHLSKDVQELRHALEVRLAELEQASDYEGFALEAGLSPADYQDVVPNPQERRKLEELTFGLQQAHDRADEELRRSQAALAEAKAGLNGAKQRLNQLGHEEALPASRIPAGFDYRESKREVEDARHKVASEREQLRDQREQLKNASRLALGNAIRTEALALVDRQEQEVPLPEGDLADALYALETELSRSETTCGELARKSDAAMRQALEEIAGMSAQAQESAAVLHSLRANHEKVTSAARFTQLGDIVREKAELVRKLADKKRESLAQLEHEIGNASTQARDYAARVAQEIQQLQDESRVSVTVKEDDERVQTAHMISFRLAGKAYNPARLKDRAAELVDEYVRDQIDKLAQLQEDEREPIAKSRLSTSALFYAYAGSNDMRVTVPVFRAGGVERGHDWQTIMGKPSGGESELIRFGLFMSFMRYMHVKGTPAANARKSRSFVLIDNPFSAITSGYLVEYMRAIAEHYRTQLVCFTAPEGEGIDRIFTTVIVMKATGKSRVEGLVAHSEKGGAAVNLAERMSHATSTVDIEQLSLF